MGGAYNAGLGKINSQMDHGTKGQKWVQFFPSDPGKLGNQLPLGAPTVSFRGHGTVRSVGGIGISRFLLSNSSSIIVFLPLMSCSERCACDEPFLFNAHFASNIRTSELNYSRDRLGSRGEGYL